MSLSAETSADFCSHVPTKPLHTHRTANTARLLAGGMVDIHVGPSQKHYQLHKTLLCHCSAFFQSAFRGPFREAASGTINLVDDAPEVFDLVVRWMYQGAIEPLTRQYFTGGNNNNNNNTNGGSSGGGVDPLLHLQLFVLADKLQMPALQQHALDAVRRGLRRANAYLPAPQLLYVLHNTPARSSALRRFAVDLTAFAMCRMRVQAATFRPCVEASVDFACELVAAVQAAYPSFVPLADPRGGDDDDDGAAGGCGTVTAAYEVMYGNGPGAADAGNSMRANLSQAGSEDVPVGEVSWRW